jgi:predicted DNA-binding transcriptional regulator YafY
LHNLYASLNIEKTSKDNKLKNAILPQESGYLRGMEHFELFANAIKKEIPVSFIHYSYKKKRFKTLIVHPYLLKESIDRWYVVGYSEDPEHAHDEFRFFGLDRIYDPVLIERKFKPCNDANELRGIFKNKIGISTINNIHTSPEEITLFVSREMANYVKSLPIHPSQVHEELYSTGDIKIKLQLIPTIELITLILSYGEHMQVIKPEWLKKEIKNKLQKTLGKYL